MRTCYHGVLLESTCAGAFARFEEDVTIWFRSQLSFLNYEDEDLKHVFRAYARYTCLNALETVKTG